MCLQKLIDDLVYQHLIENKLFKTAELLLEERIRFQNKYCLEDHKVSEKLFFVISQFEKKPKKEPFYVKEEPLDNKEVKCSICKKDFGLKDSLKKHTTDVHEEKEAEMSKGKKSKKRKQHLKVIKANNVDVHEEKKAQKCSTKELDIGQKVSLKEHAGEVHERKETVMPKKRSLRKRRNI